MLHTKPGDPDTYKLEIPAEPTQSTSNWMDKEKRNENEYIWSDD